MKPSIDLAWPCLRLDGQGTKQRVVIDLSVSPNARRTELVGWHDGALRIRLAAAPIEGAANEALRRWLAKELELPQADIALLRGTSGRRKQWLIDAEPRRVEAWLQDQVNAGRLTSLTL